MLLARQNDSPVGNRNLRIQRAISWRQREIERLRKEYGDLPVTEWYLVDVNYFALLNHSRDLLYEVDQ